MVVALVGWLLWPCAHDLSLAPGPSVPTVDARIVAPVGCDLAARREPMSLETELEAGLEPAPATPVSRIETASKPRAGLEVHVTQDGEPVAGALVKVWIKADPYEESVIERREPQHFGVTDRDGLARFELSGHVEITAEFGRARTAARERCRGATTRCELVFGSTQLTGSVYGMDGAPRPGVQVFVTPVPVPSQQHDENPYVVVTDVAGAFVLDGLPSRQLRVWWSGIERPRITYFATTAPGRRTHVRLGATPAAQHWRGRVVDTAGGGVRGWLAVDFAEARSGEMRRAYTQIDGTFDVVLPVGTWSARVAYDALGRELPFACTGVVADRDVQQDIVLPGQRVLLRLVPGSPTTQVRLAEVTVHLKAAEQRLGTRPPFLWQGDYWLQWIALPAGSYTLHSPPNALPHVASLEQLQRLELTAGAPLLQLDLTVR